MGSIPPPASGRQPPIVVLGARVLPGGQPSPALKRRVLHGLQCFRQSDAAVLVFTGGGDPPFSEARVMRAVAVANGVRSDRIVLEESSRSTLDSAEACAILIKAAGWRKALVVTERYHLPRALGLFYCFGVHARGSPPPIALKDCFRRPQLWMILRELLAIPWNLLRLALRKIHRRRDGTGFFST